MDGFGARREARVRGTTWIVCFAAVSAVQCAFQFQHVRRPILFEMMSTISILQLSSQWYRRIYIENLDNFLAVDCSKTGVQWKKSSNCQPTAGEGSVCQASNKTRNGWRILPQDIGL